MRRDAIDRRTALIKAAAQCFQDYGYLVPLEQIAACAKVGRGTLYRNFADRTALATAVFEREVEELADTLARIEEFDEAFRRLVDWLARSAVFYNRFAADIKGEQGSVGARALLTRAAELWDPLIERGRELGRLGPNVRAETLTTIGLMVAGVIASHQDESVIRSETDNALALLWPALRSGATAPPPKS